MINIEVSRTMKADIGDVYQTLIQVDKYQEWWPIYIRVIHYDDKVIKIYPTMFTCVELRLKQFSHNEFIELEYISGPFRGLGQWRLYQHRPTNNIEVTYTVLLEPTNVLIRVIAKTKLFRNKHINDIVSILIALEQKCSRN